MNKKILSLLMAALLLCLCACGENKTSETDVIKSGDKTDTKEEQTVETEAFSCTVKDVQVTPGETMDAGLAEKADSCYQVPSCAIEGTDNVYSYGCCEITAFKQDDAETVYSVYFLTDEISTPEGISLGSGLDDVKKAYGSEFENLGTSYTYTKGSTSLVFIVEGDAVTSVEYLFDYE